MKKAGIFLLILGIVALIAAGGCFAATSIGKSLIEKRLNVTVPKGGLEELTAAIDRAEATTGVPFTSILRELGIKLSRLEFRLFEIAVRTRYVFAAAGGVLTIAGIALTVAGKKRRV